MLFISWTSYLFIWIYLDGAGLKYMKQFKKGHKL
jgi:hypothetical protein